ncbi:MAG: peptidase C15 [Leptolyngbyaceae cyanobacterium SM1_4_3]|nr:peptidase C15 [Leptolyngbyaceae cyanobacterium SM1_4_3]NJN90134.1 peptidase C15 [Leptolyngbyaceae cyanobacterium SL_5_14]
MTQILLTSFTTWKAHQRSNASDDLLIEIQKNSSSDLVFLRQLPVDFRLAPEQAIAHINKLQPDAIILCGMAESRQKLTVESRAIAGETIFHTKVDLEKLVKGLEFTEISQDAGQFVCEALYFATLKHLQEASSDCLCMFVHVPILTPANSQLVTQDFQAMIESVRGEVCQAKAKADILKTP